MQNSSDAGHRMNPQLALNPAVLTAGARSPFRFQWAISGAAPSAESRVFRLTGPDRAGVMIEREYCVAEISHNAYLDMFEQLAKDYGTRLPRNKQPPEIASAEIPYQPLLTENLAPEILYGYGDPAVLRVSGDSAVERSTWYLVVTSNDAPHVFPILRSRDLKHWELSGFVFPPGQEPPWAATGRGVSDFWAAEMHLIEGEFRVYFAAREKNGSELAIGVARSSRPEGPFIPLESPLLRGGVIDPHVVVDAKGTAFLFWKEDTNDVWPSRLAELLHHAGELIPELFPALEDQRTASLMQSLWPWLKVLDPMERFFIQQIFIEASTASFAALQQRLIACIKVKGDPRLEVLRRLFWPP